MTGFGRILAAATVAVACSAVLTGCEDRSQKGDARPPTSAADRAALRTAPASADTAGAPPRRKQAEVPQFHGKPMWADNRRGTAEENVRYQFEHRGGDLGAKSVDDYLTKVHAFFDNPPKDLESVVRPSNGDTLVYSASANLFGVLRKDGAPRLLMKPPGGRAYWESQKAQQGGRGGAAEATR